VSDHDEIAALKRENEDLRKKLWLTWNYHTVIRQATFEEWCAVLDRDIARNNELLNS
jgi:hypothetical protein